MPGIERLVLPNEEPTWSSDHGRCWNIVPGTAQGLGRAALQDESSDRVVLWLLEAPQLETLTVISPYAVLDIQRLPIVEGASSPESVPMPGFNYRLVSMNPEVPAEIKNGVISEDNASPEFLLTLVEHQLIAGGDFRRASDESAILSGHLAVNKFRLGRLQLRDYQGWEAHFI